MQQLLITFYRSGCFPRRIKQLRWSTRVNFSSVSVMNRACPLTYRADFALTRKPSTFWIRLEPVLVDFERLHLRFQRRPRPRWVQTHVRGLPLEPPQSCSSLAPRVFEEAQCGTSILLPEAAKVTSFRRSRISLFRRVLRNAR